MPIGDRARSGTGRSANFASSCSRTWRRPHTQDLTVTNGASEGVDPAELSGATRGERLLLAVLANLGVTQPSPDLPALAEMASRANAGDTLLQDITADGTLYWAALTTLAFGDRYEEAEARLLAAEEDSRVRGSSRGLGLCGAFGSPVLYRMGRLAQAEQGALRALELFADEPLMASYAAAFSIDSLIDQGKLDDARRALAGVVLEGHPPLLCFALLRLTAARLLARKASMAAAADQLLEVGAELGATSSVVWPWRVEAALALHQAGAAERALELQRRRSRRRARCARHGCSHAVCSPSGSSAISSSRCARL